MVSSGRYYKLLKLRQTQKKIIEIFDATHIDIRRTLCHSKRKIAANKSSRYDRNIVIFQCIKSAEKLNTAFRRMDSQTVIYRSLFRTKGFKEIKLFSTETNASKAIHDSKSRKLLW